MVNAADDVEVVMRLILENLYREQIASRCGFRTVVRYVWIEISISFLCARPLSNFVRFNQIVVLFQRLHFVISDICGQET